MKQPIAERVRNWFRTHIKIPRPAVIAICVFPAVTIILFYILRPFRDAMDWVCAYISRPVRGFFSMIYSIYPPAIMEILCTAGGIFLIWFIIKAIRDCYRRRDRWKLLGRRMLGLLVAVCYLYGGWCWLWSAGYHTTGFAERYELTGEGVEIAELTAVTQMFAERASELSASIERDEKGDIIFNRGKMLDESTDIYKKISREFPSLQRTVYRPKPMYLYSWLMTITGYTGMYFALTGESMINYQQHPAYMPNTAAHEIAHQLGIYAEDEANFVGILACVTSGNPVFEYAGYLAGYGYLSNALAGADIDSFAKISDKLSDEVIYDRQKNSEFWSNAQVSRIGFDWLDNILTTVMETANDVVDSVYDDYLKSQDQELGLQSYGACVDLLVFYFCEEASR